jgi:hypothetical protein
MSLCLLKSGESITLKFKEDVEEATDRTLILTETSELIHFALRVRKLDIEIWSMPEIDICCEFSW